MPRLPLHALLEEHRVLPVSLVKEYEWCPLIPWIAFNTGFTPPITPSMAMGLEGHGPDGRLLEKAAKALGYQNPQYNIYLEDPRLEVAGTLDILAAEEREIAEVKKTNRRKPQAQEKLQAAIYALLAYRNGFRVEKANIVLVDAQEKITIAPLEVTGELLARAEKKVRELWETVTSPIPPLVLQAPEKCRYCRYRRKCPYRWDEP